MDFGASTNKLTATRKTFNKKGIRDIFPLFSLLDTRRSPFLSNSFSCRLYVHRASVLSRQQLSTARVYTEREKKEKHKPIKRLFCFLLMKAKLWNVCGGMFTHVKLFFRTQTFANQFLKCEEQKAVMQSKPEKVAEEKNRREAQNKICSTICSPTLIDRA